MLDGIVQTAFLVSTGSPYRLSAPLWRMKGTLLITALGQQAQTGTVVDTPGSVASPPPVPGNCSGSCLHLCCQGSCHSGSSLGQELGEFEVEGPQTGLQEPT